MYGLAGRDFTVEHVYQIFEEMDAHIKNGTEVEQYQYIGLRK
jgi:pyruvate ferredoxin oxidoreductase alpha subunit